MSQPNLNAVRASSIATLDEIRSTERSLKAKGIDTDDGEWMQLRDIVLRIERRLMAAGAK